MDIPEIKTLDKESKKELKKLIKANKQGKSVNGYIDDRLSEHVNMIPNTYGVVVWPTIPKPDDEYETLKATFDRLLNSGYLYKRPDGKIDLTIDGKVFFKRRKIIVAVALLVLVVVPVLSLFLS